MVMSGVFLEVLFLRRIRKFMMAKLESYPAPIMEDSREATKLANSKPAGRRTKHINIKYEIVRNTIAEGKVPINETKGQDADMLKNFSQAVVYQPRKDCNKSSFGTLSRMWF